MNNNIPKTIDLIVNEQEYQRYFFENFNKMKNPESWFTPLYNSKLLHTRDKLVLPYIRSLIKHKNLYKDKNFIKILNYWLEYFLNDLADIVLVIWFIEEVITIDDADLNTKCKEIIYKHVSNISSFCYIVTKLNSSSLDKLILTDYNFAYEIITVITADDNFSALSSNNYILLQVRDKLSQCLHSSMKLDIYIDLILSRLYKYLKENPTEFIILDTIDQSSLIFNYSNYIIGWLLSIINQNTSVDNNKLCSKVEVYIKDNNISEKLEISFFLKIITYLIEMTSNFGMIAIIQSHTKSLDILSHIKFALYYNVLKNGIDLNYEFLPEFENWLINLEFSSSFIKEINDYKLIDTWSLEIKLQLLKIFGEDRISYKKLKENYSLTILMPEKQFNSKSSWESTNNYLNNICKKSIDEIIRTLNGEPLDIETDFPELHLEEAIKKDFNQNLEKYNSKIKYIFEHINNDSAKSWFVQEIAGVGRSFANPVYKEILDILLNSYTNNLIYFISILDLLNSLLRAKEPLANYDDKIQNFLFMNEDKLINEIEDIDTTGGGINSISGKCIEILIQINLQKNESFDSFIINIDKYKCFIEKVNGSYVLGKYLFWLYKIPKFQEWFKQVNSSSQVIILSAFFKYTPYINNELYDYAKKINLLISLDNIYPYMNHVFYMYIEDLDNYLINIIKKNLDNESILNSIIASVGTYEKQIIEKSLENKVLYKVWKELLESKHKNKISAKLLHHADFININKTQDMQLLKLLMETQTLNSINHIQKAHNKLIELQQCGKYHDLLDILEKIAANEQRNFYGTSLHYLDDLMSKIESTIKPIDKSYEKFINLRTRLKQINYQ